MHLYDPVRLYTNFSQPIMKLKAETRHGAKVHKVYDTARSPNRRLLETGALTPDQEAALAAIYSALNPVNLLQQVNIAVQQLWAKPERPVVAVIKAVSAQHYAPMLHAGAENFE